MTGYGFEKYYYVWRKNALVCKGCELWLASIDRVNARFEGEASLPTLWTVSSCWQYYSSTSQSSLRRYHRWSRHGIIQNWRMNTRSLEWFHLLTCAEKMKPHSRKSGKSFENDRMFWQLLKGNVFLHVNQCTVVARSQLAHLSICQLADLSFSNMWRSVLILWWAATNKYGWKTLQIFFVCLVGMKRSLKKCVRF